jgi:hypothetical protein
LSFGVDDSLPGYIVVVEVLRWISREMLQTYAYLTRSLCCIVLDDAGVAWSKLTGSYKRGDVAICSDFAIWDFLDG